jgi:Tol biopolymer transport system component
MNKFWVVAIVSAAMAVPGFMPAQTASRPETQLEAANKKALVSGDLEAAIRQYRDIVAKYPNNRPVAAEALLRMAQCYEKQGAAKAQEAHKAYDRIVREYADQKAAAAEAQRHLTAPLAQIEDRLNVRTVPVAQDNRTYPNSISRDGNSLVFIKADGLYVHNVARNEERRIVTREGAGVQYSSPDISGDGKLVTYARTSKSNGELCVVAADGTNSRLVLKTKEQIIVAKISRDGKQIAYVAGSQGDLQELRIVGTDGSKPRLVFDGKTGSDKPEAFGTSEWSPDGSHFLAWYGVGSQGGHLVLVETANGSQNG